MRERMKVIKREESKINKEYHKYGNIEGKSKNHFEKKFKRWEEEER